MLKEVVGARDDEADHNPCDRAERELTGSQRLHARQSPTSAFGPRPSWILSPAFGDRCSLGARVVAGEAQTGAIAVRLHREGEAVNRNSEGDVVGMTVALADRESSGCLVRRGDRGRSLCDEKILTNPRSLNQLRGHEIVIPAVGRIRESAGHQIRRGPGPTDLPHGDGRRRSTNETRSEQLIRVLRSQHSDCSCTCSLNNNATRQISTSDLDGRVREVESGRATAPFLAHRHRPGNRLSDGQRLLDFSGQQNALGTSIECISRGREGAQDVNRYHHAADGTYFPTGNIPSRSPHRCQVKQPLDAPAGHR